MLDFIRDSYSDSEVSDKDYLNLYSSVDLLVIDDLGKEKPTEWVLEKLFLIVNNRYNNYLPIVITTNYNRNQLRERLCINKNYSIVDSIISRLYEMCGGIEIKDDDHRMSDSLIRESLRNSWYNRSISKITLDVKRLVADKNVTFLFILFWSKRTKIREIFLARFPFVYTKGSW